MGISGDIFKSFLSRAQIRNIVYRSDSYCNLFLLCSLPYLTIPGLCRLSHPTYPTPARTPGTHTVQWDISIISGHRTGQQATRIRCKFCHFQIEDQSNQHTTFLSLPSTSLSSITHSPLHTRATSGSTHSRTFLASTVASLCCLTFIICFFLVFGRKNIIPGARFPVF